MRKITLLLFALLFSFVGYSQFPTPGTEGFENTTGLDLALPASTSPWTLGTGAVGNQWAVFDNGVVGSPQRRWDRATSNFYAGTQAAFINRKQNGAAGVISEDYLATPLVTVPTNGQLTFYTRTGFNTADDVNFLIKVNTNTAAGSQTTLANYTNTVQTWNNASPIVATYNVYELKTVDLSAYAGQQVYIAFVRVFNQPSGALGGNSWYVDEVKLVQQCLAPTNQTATGITQTTANLSWTNPSGSTSWEIEVIPVTGTPTGVGTIYNGALPYVATGLTPATGYAYFVRSRCTDSNSVWVGPFNFTTVTPGLTCATASIIPPTLPYNTTDTTANYSDTTDATQPAACAGTATNFMTGNDVFYSYTPTTTGAISISMTPGGTNSGIFVYQGCANVGVTCLAGVANTGTGVRSIPTLNVTAGQTYIIVLSSISTTQTYSYNLLIQQLNCIPPSTLGANTITPTGATLTWTNPTSTSWEYVVQTAGSPLPTVAGTQTSSSTLTTATGLNPDTAYQYWVRSDCGDGTFSPWSGPFLFTTAVAPPVCGGQFLDAGGQAGNYANNSNITYPICPTTAGDQVTVTFTAFNTQLNTDLLKVYDGNGVTGALLATYSGTTIPAPITSSSPDGCLTFVFTSNASTASSGWVANVTCVPAPVCQKPILLTTPTVLYNSVQLAWTQPANPDTSVPSAWEVIAVPCGSPAPTASTTPVITAGTNPFTVTGLTPLTCYDLYVRAVCSSTSTSSWSGPVAASTPIAPPICGGNFVDTGGISGNYANNANYSTPICPTNPGDQVTVTFTAFNTQLNTDLLKVYDGNGVTGTLLATYSGTTIPAPITSSSPDGCLTFVFTSNGATTATGWLANVTCAPAPACQKPILLSAPAVTVLYNSVTLAWIQTANPDTSVPSAWEVVALPCGSPAPTATTAPVITATTNPFTVTGLIPLTCYDFYVRAVCSSTSVSAWTGPTTATTPIAPPICGGNFVDPGGIAGNYANNITAATGTTIISPVTPGDQVTVTFTSFNTQLNTDLLLVYDGIGTTGTLLATFSGTTVPQPITSSSPNGSLTFVFTSNASTNASGWMANVTCAPAPACQKPVALAAPPVTVLYNSVTLNWVQPANPDTSVTAAWEVVALPCGSPAPTATTAPVITAPNNPFIVTGLAPLTCYDFYVRAVCSSTSVSTWSGPVSATTPISPPICGGNFVDPGGLAGAYPNNVTAATGTTIISPVTPGDQVTVTFTSFNTQLNTDLLLVYDGIGTAGTLLATFSGTTIPQPITSSSPEGSLTFVFTSNANTTAPGWLANVTCSPAPACQKPILLTIPPATVSYNSVVLGWTQPANPDTTVATAWEVVALPCGSPAPTATTTPVLTTTNNLFTVPNLLIATCYDFYVRAVCSSTSSSSWSGPKSVSTSTCSVPTLVTAGITTGTSASVGWTETGIATEWEIIYLPAGSPAPGLTSTGLTVTTNPAIITGLTIGTFYDVYVRSHCTATGSSGWSTSTSLYVNPPLPNCAGVSLNLTTTSPGVIDVCPDDNCVNLSATYTDSYDTTSYNVFSTPYAPAFPFTGGNQVSVNTDDVWSGNIAIPFKFCFYGNVYNALNIGSNGVVTFDTHAANSNCPWAFTAQIPNTTFPIRNAIYAPYQDINPNVVTAPAVPNINYQILGVAPCRVMVINFSKVAQFSCGVTVGLQTSQVVLYETSNVIDIYIKDRTSCTTWNSGSGVIGIQNGAGTNAVVPPGRNTGTWSAQNEAWRFLPSGASNVTFQWLQDGLPLTTSLNANICVTQDTNMTAQATYTACDGTQVIKSENVLLNLLNTVTPTFTAIGPLCQGVTAPVLPTTSNNTPVAITGVWSPATIDTSVPGTVTHTFTPTAGQCANITTMDVTVNNGVTPLFNTPPPICTGTPAPILPTISNNVPVAITGVWSPAIVSNTASGTYTFTPNAGQCASVATLDVTVSSNCSLGSYASAIWLTNCATSNFFNTVGSGTGIIGPIGNVFPNSNLGTYVQNSNTFILRGAALKTFKSTSGNVCSTRLNYRIYPAASTPGAFQIMDLPFFEDCTTGNFPSGGTCNPGDQKWQRIVADGTTTPYSPVNLTTYAPGNYVMQVYYDISGSSSSLTGCDENVLIDNNGAYFTATFTIQAQPTYTNVNPTTCNGTNGSITISGMAPSTVCAVSYNDGATAIGPLNLSSSATGEIVITGLNAGTYSNFSITLNSCVYNYTIPIVLVDPSIPTVTVNSPTVCSGIPATITATPGTTGTYTYVWSYPSGFTDPGNVNSFTTTILGVYSVVITNTVTGCSSTSASGTVNVNTLITPTFASIAPICSGGTAPVLSTTSNNTTPIVGVWSPAVINTTLVGNTLYTFTPNTGQCSESISINVTVNSVPTPIVSAVVQPSCSTPTGTIEVSSPISGASVVPTDLFISEVTDADTGSLTYVEIFNGTGSSKNLSNYKLKIYNNGSSTTSCDLTLSGIIANNATNVIKVSTDANQGGVIPNQIFFGCGGVNNNDNIRLTTNLDVVIDNWGRQDGVAFTPLTSPGFTYRRHANASPLPNPSSVWNAADWDALDPEDYSNVGTFAPFSNSQYVYNVDGGTYQTSPIFAGLNPGNHNVTVQDVATGCVSVIVPITLNSIVLNPSVTTFSYTTPVCLDVTSSLTPNTSTLGFTTGGTFSLTSGTGLSVNASTGVVNLATAAAGTYQITYSVAANPTLCLASGSTSFTLVINALPTVTVNSPSVCIGQTATITATPGTLGTYSYAWTVPTGATNPGNVATFNPTIPGSYCVVITNTTTGCSSSCIAGTVTINPLPTVTVNNPTPVCVGQNVALIATPGATGTYTYSWIVPSGTNPGNVASFNATVSGNYSVTVTNALGCTSTPANSTVTLIPIPVVTVSDATICQGTIATVTATPATSGTYSYTWTVPSGTNPGNVASFTTSISGVYSVVITNTATGCSSLSDSGTVSFVPAFDFVLNGECLNSNFILEVLPSGSSFDLNTASFNWTLNSITVGTNATFDASAYFHDPAVTTQLPVTFNVNVTTSDGCQLSHSILVNRIYCEIQKGISPNNDTKNDFFDLRLMNVDRLEIFNRYGTKVYSKSDYTNQWIGQSDAGNELPDGTYFYVIQFKNNQPSTTGWIYINRDSK